MGKGINHPIGGVKKEELFWEVLWMVSESDQATL